MPPAARDVRGGLLQGARQSALALGLRAGGEGHGGALLGQARGDGGADAAAGAGHQGDLALQGSVRVDGGCHGIVSLFCVSLTNP